MKYRTICTIKEPAENGIWLKEGEEATISHVDNLSEVVYLETPENLILPVSLNVFNRFLNPVNS